MMLGVRGQVTGATTCLECGEKVLVCNTGARFIVLDTQMIEGGGWNPFASSDGRLFADFTPRPKGRDVRVGHAAHTLRCKTRLASTEERSKERVKRNLVEGSTRLPVVQPDGVRALLGASS